MHHGRDSGRWSLQWRLEDYQLEDGRLDLRGLVYHTAFISFDLGWPHGLHIECSSVAQHVHINQRKGVWEGILRGIVEEYYFVLE